MSIFSRKGDPQPTVATPQSTEQNEELNYDGTVRQRPEVREEDFIDTSDPNYQPSTLPATQSATPLDRPVIVEYTTGMPIDGVYIYMEKDWEEQGKQDATSNPDMSYMESKVEIIKQGLQRRFELTRLKYNKMIREYSAKVDSLNQFGLSGTLNELDAHIETCKEHLQKLNELEEKFRRDDPALRSMVNSYRRGFAFGVARAAQDAIKDNNYTS